MISTDLSSHGDDLRPTLRPYQAPLLSGLGAIYERTAGSAEEIACIESGGIPIFQDSVFSCTTPAP